MAVHVCSQHCEEEAELRPQGPPLCPPSAGLARAASLSIKPRLARATFLYEELRASQGYMVRSFSQKAKE